MAAFRGASIMGGRRVPFEAPVARACRRHVCAGSAGAPGPAPSMRHGHFPQEIRRAVGRARGTAAPGRLLREPGFGVRRCSARALAARPRRPGRRSRHPARARALCDARAIEPQHAVLEVRRRAGRDHRPSRLHPALPRGRPRRPPPVRFAGLRRREPGTGRAGARLAGAGRVRCAARRAAHRARTYGSPAVVAVPGHPPAPEHARHVRRQADFDCRPAPPGTRGLRRRRATDPAQRPGRPRARAGVRGGRQQCPDAGQGVRRGAEGVDPLLGKRRGGAGRRPLRRVVRQPVGAILAGPPRVRPVLHGEGRERQVRQAPAQFRRGRRLRRARQRPRELARSGPRVRALRPAGHGARRPHGAPEPAGGVAALRPAFAAFAGVPGRRPDLVVRFGRGPTLPPSLRRPVQAVLL